MTEDFYLPTYLVVLKHDSPVKPRLLIKTFGYVKYLEIMVDVECDICFSRFSRILKAPTTLLCGHTYCLDCVRRIGRNNIRYLQVSLGFEEFFGYPLYIPETPPQRHKVFRVKCPKCRDYTIFGAVNSMHKNLLLIDLLEKLNMLDDDTDVVKQNVKTLLSSIPEEI